MNKESSEEYEQEPNSTANSFFLIYFRKGTGFLDNNQSQRECEETIEGILYH